MWNFVGMAANIVVEIIVRNSWQLMHFRKIVIILFFFGKKMPHRFANIIFFL